MSNIDLQRMLTAPAGGGIDPMANLTSNAQRQLALGAQANQIMSQGVRGMLTGDKRNPDQKRKDQFKQMLKNFPTMSVEEQIKTIDMLRQSGNSKMITVASQLAGQVQKKQTQLAQDTRRENMVSQADSLGLAETSTLLTDGGSLAKGEEDIRKAQEAKLLSEQGRKGKEAIASLRNVGAPMLKAIAKGDYDSLSNEEFMKVLSGEKATLKVYTDSSGQAKPFRVNESGRVYNKDTEKWVMPSELGLTQAAQLTKTITDADRISSKLRDKATDNFFVANEKALSAQKILEINANSRSLMEEGIITGAGANFLSGMASIGVQLGIVPQGVEDTLIATQTFMAERGKQVLALLGSGDVGSGTGISDKDVAFMKEVAGQQITLNKETLSRIMRIEERAARNAIATSNSRLGVMKQYVGADEDSALLDTFFVPMPEPSVTGYVPTQAAQNYLEQARDRRTQQVPQ
ncbi:hypothetical protein N9Z29_00315 [bacterium]|nr:hypothetical protein [bacterium]